MKEEKELKKKVANEAVIEVNKKRGEKTRKDILKAIATLQKKGEAVNMTKIAKLSGYSRQAIYNHKDFINENVELKGYTINEREKLDNTIRKLKEENSSLKKEIKELKKSYNGLVEKYNDLKS